MSSKLKSRKKLSPYILVVALVAVAAFIIVEFLSIQFEILQKKSQLEQINANLAALEVSNEQLKRYYAEENRMEYIEQIARDQLDYSYADETVYYFIPK